MLKKDPYSSLMQRYSKSYIFLQILCIFFDISLSGEYSKGVCISYEKRLRVDNRNGMLEQACHFSL